ncbi:N-acetyl-alpha-D-glucosaminyl L-malate synthase [bacterium HR40]|nr:N-acetyl-alpha-D-glucosaminyl L-malate synthase [bacterium HR40]
MAGPPHLVHVFPSFATGGMQTVVLGVLNTLGGVYRHTILTLDGRCDAAARLQPQVVAEILDASKIRGLFARRGTLARLSPDLLLTYNWGSMDWVFAHLLHRLCPHLHAEHGFGLDEAFRRHRRRNLARRLVLRRVDALVVPSRTLARLARQEWGIPPSRIAFLPNGVRPLDRPTDPPARDRLRLGTLAPLRPEKRLDRLLRLVDRLPPLPPVELLVGGDGPERPALEQLRASLGRPERVRLLGRIDDPASFLADLDLFLLTSDTEQMPAAVLEAMAAGLPIVAFAVGDVRQMVAAGNRPYIVPAGDEAAFGIALRALVERADLRALLGRANRARQRRLYTVDRMAEAYDRLWRTHLATGRR